MSQSFLSRLRKETSGVSAIEFAFVAPVMALIFFGCLEVSELLAVDRRVTNAAATLGDLVARDDEITNPEMNDIFAATDFIFQPLDTANRSMRITSVYLTTDNKTLVRWSDSRGLALPALKDESPYTLPAGVMTGGQSVIVAEVQYGYSSTVGYILSNEQRLSDVFYLKPRRNDEVARNRE